MPPKRIAGGLTAPCDGHRDLAFELSGVQGLIWNRVAWSFNIAFPKVERDFVERVLLPDFGLREPE